MGKDDEENDLKSSVTSRIPLAQNKKRTEESLWRGRATVGRERECLCDCDFDIERWSIQFCWCQLFEDFYLYKVQTMSHPKLTAGVEGMTLTKIADDQHREIKKYDRNRDIEIVLGVAIAIVSSLAAVAGIIAVYAGGFLETYRKDVSSVWLTVVPFCFPVITGVGVAYRRQMSSVGVHFVLLLATMLAGCIGYGFAIEPVFINRFNCTKVDNSHGECHRETIVHLWISAGGVAIGFSALGVILTLLACSFAVKKRALRNEERIREEERKFKELQEQKKNAFKPTSAPVSKCPTRATFSTVASEPRKLSELDGSSSNLNGIVINIISDSGDVTHATTAHGSVDANHLKIPDSGDASHNKIQDSGDATTHL
ncbi:hypothetical protein Btru_076519 [Bulinus truncatus]|nr:hypothetical protein Btru_076519 [Bulinus truncatus]